MTPAEYRTLIEAVRDVLAEEREQTALMVGELRAEVAAVERTLTPAIQGLASVAEKLTKAMQGQRKAEVDAIGDAIVPALRDYLQRSLAPIGERLRALEGERHE